MNAGDATRMLIANTLTKASRGCRGCLEFFKAEDITLTTRVENAITFAIICSNCGTGGVTGLATIQSADE